MIELGFASCALGHAPGKTVEFVWLSETGQIQCFSVSYGLSFFFFFLFLSTAISHGKEQGMGEC